ncbi:MAG: tyrosine recombinase XerC [Syntrophomonadaceae bacterium]|nr:tyrosine recombinase XerC [Syntrophomonadaceae bacterium]
MIFKEISSFLRYLRIEKNSSPLTMDSYETDLHQFFDFLSREYNLRNLEITGDFLTHHNVRKYLIFLQNEEYARTTIARKLAAIKSFVKYLVRMKIIEDNFIDAVNIPKIEKRLPQFLYPEQITILLAAPNINTNLGIRDKAIMETLYATGIRVSELVSLDVLDIDFPEELVRVWGKGGKERIVPIGSYAKNSLNIYLKEARPLLVKGNANEKALFLNKNGSRLSDRSVRNILNKYVDEVALNQRISPHAIRHSFATHLLNNGADLRSVQELLGHVKLNTTQIYTHLTKDNIKTIHNNTHPRR